MPVEPDTADRIAKLDAKKGTKTVTDKDLIKEIQLQTERARSARLTLELRRANVYRDLQALETAQAAADAARARKSDPIRSATGRIVGWIGKE